MTPQQQVIAKCNEMVAKCMTLYGLDMRGVSISFDLRGRSAGRASAQGYMGAIYNPTIKFNRDMLTREAFDHVLNNTVPHEFAHMVCFMKPELGSNHNSGWARVCEQLGGNGKRFHSEEVVYGVGKTYEYTTSTGCKVRLSERRHKYVQQGGGLSYNKGATGRLDKNSPYSIVGVGGRTLAAPVVRVAAPAPVIQQPAALKQAVGFTGAMSTAAKACSIMVAARNTGRAYSTIIDAIVFATNCDRETAEDIYWANHEKLGLPAAPETV